MDPTVQAGSARGSLDDLIGPLLRDMAALARAEDVVIALQPLLLCMEQDSADQAVLDEDDPLLGALAEYTDSMATNIAQLYADRLGHSQAGLPEKREEQSVPLVVGHVDELVDFCGGQVVGEALAQVL